jgi:UPF0755 protein
MSIFAKKIQKKMDRKRTLVIWAFNIVSIIALAMTFRCFKLIVSPQIVTYDFSIYITPNNTADDIVKMISKNEPKANLTGLKWMMKLKNYDDNVPTGHYVIKRGYSAKNIADLLARSMQTPVKVVINSTRTVDQIATTISSQLMMDSATIAEKLNDIEYLKSQGYNGNSVFCLIVPNTYEFYWNVSIDGFIKRMIKERDAFWNESRVEKAKAIGLTPEEVMTLASIVEEETAKNDELPIVAGLYIN